MKFFLSSRLMSLNDEISNPNLHVIYNNPTNNKNNYYVLKFDFSSISGNNEEELEKSFNSTVLASLRRFIEYYGINIEERLFANEPDAANILKSFLYIAKLDKKIYVIIDEYDNFTNSILSNNFELFKNVLGDGGFVKTFYSVLKENSGTVIDRMFITGVCSISLDAMTSGFNIGTNITNDSWFNAMTALTHEEVLELIKDIPNSKDIYNDLIDNYDGYKFSENEEMVFNTTLVMYYLNYYYQEGMKPHELLDSNIISNYTQLKNIITLNNNIYKEVIDAIYDNKYIRSELVVTFDFNENRALNRADIISLLYYMGYLTIKELNFGDMYK